MLPASRGYGKGAMAINHMPAQRVAFGQIGAIEIVCRIVRHSDLLHQSARAQIRGDGEGHDIAEAQRLVAIPQHGARLRWRSRVPDIRKRDAIRFRRTA